MFSEGKIFLGRGGATVFCGSCPVFDPGLQLPAGISNTVPSLREIVLASLSLHKGYMSSDTSDACFLHLQSVPETEFHFFMALLQTINLEEGIVSKFNQAVIYKRLAV